MYPSGYTCRLSCSYFNDVFVFLLVDLVQSNCDYFKNKGRNPSTYPPNDTPGSLVEILTIVALSRNYLKDALVYVHLKTKILFCLSTTVVHDC